ncbi:MAG: nucleoside-diphosphate kinase [Candidatus Aenigmatarchaeota archaeon]
MRTLLFLKPDAVVRRYVGARVIKEILEKGFGIEYFGKASPSREFIAEEHYGEHKGKFFHEWLVDYASSSYVLVMVLSGDNVIDEVRDMLGDTWPEKAGPGTVRGKYGVLGGINVAHASDSEESARREIELWEDFIEMENVDYRKSAEEYMRKNLDRVMIDPVRYREVSKAIIDERIDPDVAQEKFSELLKKESDFSGKGLENLAEAMVDNALLRKEED